jgi:hypothetical protein
MGKQQPENGARKMRLYEMRQRPGRCDWGIKSAPAHTEYFTSKEPAMAAFRNAKSTLVSVQLAASLQVNLIDVKTALKALDWIQLLQSDAPGHYCEKTPVDFITSRKTLVELKLKGGPQ